jgi:hypothetical protein
MRSGLILSGIMPLQSDASRSRCLPLVAGTYVGWIWPHQARSDGHLGSIVSPRSGDQGSGRVSAGPTVVVRPGVSPLGDPGKR